jgi:hypothetical protein
LADDELGAVWRACEALDVGVDSQGASVRRPHGDIIRLLILTGQRLNEVASKFPLLMSIQDCLFGHQARRG